MSKEQVVLGMLEKFNNSIRMASLQNNLDLVEVERHIELQRESTTFLLSQIYDWLVEKDLLK